MHNRKKESSAYLQPFPEHLSLSADMHVFITSGYLAKNGLFLWPLSGCVVRSVIRPGALGFLLTLGLIAFCDLVEFKQRGVKPNRQGNLQDSKRS